MDYLNKPISSEFNQKINNIIGAIDGNGKSLFPLIKLLNIELEKINSLQINNPENEILEQNKRIMKISIMFLQLTSMC